MRLVLVSALILAPVVLAARSSAATAPPGDGADGVTVVELRLVDATRPTPAIGAVPESPERELRTWVYLPPAAEPAPLIVLAHGFDGHPRKFSDLATHWADAGYVVAVPRFPISADDFADVSGDVTNERLADIGAQAGDVAFVLDEVTGADDLAGRVDAERVGLYGLSMGSLSVWTALRNGDVGATAVDAMIQSDGGYPGPRDELADVRVPVLLAHSDADTIFPVGQVWAEFVTLPAPKYLLVLHDAVHAAVGENTPTLADEAYRVATTVFWDRHLAGRTDTPFPDDVEIDGVTTLIEG